VASLALAVGSAYAATTPFSASLAGSVTDSPCGPLTICLSGSDRGVATHLGVSTLTKTATIHLTSTSCGDGGLLTTYTETGTLQAANGDTLALSGQGTACVAAGHAIASGHLAITGGTGRFQAASGSLTERIDHDLGTDEETTKLIGMLSAR
jgi:hypothetical protein